MGIRVLRAERGEEKTSWPETMVLAKSAGVSCQLFSTGGISLTFATGKPQAPYSRGRALLEDVRPDQDTVSVQDSQACILDLPD